MQLPVAAHLFLICLFGFTFASAPLGGRDLKDLISRYREDQAVQTLDLGETRIVGELREGKLYLSERNAIEMALRNNLDVNVSRLNPLAKTWEAGRLEGFYDPTAGFGFNWDRTTAPTASLLSGGDTLTDVFTNYDFNFKQPFSTGSTIEAAFKGQRYRSTNFFFSFVPSIQTDFSIQFRQKLLEGFGKIGQEYELEVARHDVDISELEFAEVLLETISNVQVAYWNLLFSKRDVDVKEKSLELAREILSQNKARFEVGSAARLEVVEAEAEVASRQEQLVRSTFSSRQVEDRLIVLITSLEDPRDLSARIEPTESPYEPDPVSESFASLLEHAREKRPDLQRLDVERLNSHVELERTRDQLRPSLDLVLGYRQLGLGGIQVIRDFDQGFDNPPIIGTIPGGLGDSLEQLFSGNYYGYTVGLDFQIPFGNREAKADNAKAQIELQRSDLQYRQAIQEVARQIREALTEIEMNEASLKAASATVRLARERLEGQQARFEVGRSTTRDLIEAQRDLLVAAVTELQSQVNLIKSHVYLDQRVGQTFENQGIRIKDQLAQNLR